MRVPFPEVVLSARSLTARALLALPVRKAMALFRTGTTYPRTAPNVVDGREPRAGRAFLPRVRAAGVVQRAGLSR